MKKQLRGGRINRINPLIQQIISNEFLRNSDSIINKSTITDVATSPDMKRSTIYVSNIENNKGQLINALDKNRSKIQRELARKHIEKMHGLYLAKTAVMEKMCVEPAEPAEENYLETVTGQCGECWAGDWQEAYDTVFDGQLSCATAISNIAKLIYKYSEEVNLITGCLDTLADELRKQFRTQFYKDQESVKEAEK